VICGYFDAALPKEAPLYFRFAKHIANPEDIAITFNYDVLLERELHRAQKWHIGDGYGFDIVAEHSPSPVTVLKLHGSTNWIDLLFEGKGGRSGVFCDSLGPRPVLLPQAFRILGYPEATDPKFHGGSVDGVSMILPGRAKEFLVETSLNPREREQFWDSIWCRAADGLKSATEIVVVGYSLPKADERARRLILSKANRAAKVTICSGADSNRLRDEFIEAKFSSVTAITGYFEDWLDTRSG
jgi:hypothetical protein